MKRSTTTESQIVNAIKEYEAGKNAGHICHELGVYKATFYNWKKNYSGTDSYKLKRLKELEEENRKLKQMYTEMAQDQKMLKRVRRVYSANGHGPAKKDTQSGFSKG